MRSLLVRGARGEAPQLARREAGARHLLLLLLGERELSLLRVRCKVPPLRLHRLRLGPGMSVDPRGKRVVARLSARAAHPLLRASVTLGCSRLVGEAHEQRAVLVAPRVALLRVRRGRDLQLLVEGPPLRAPRLALLVLRLRQPCEQTV